MIVSDLFEEIPIASGAVNPATGKAWLPSELRTAQAKQDAEEIKALTMPTSAQSVTQRPLATSSTASSPSAIKYSGTLAPNKKAVPNFTQTKTSYKMPSSPRVPTVPNLTQAPAKVMPAPEPITIGGQKISPSDPAYAKIMKNAQTGASAAQFDTVPDFSGSQAAEQIAVKDIAGQVNRQIKLVKTKDDLKMIKQLIDKQFARHGLVSESAFAKRDLLIQQVGQWPVQTSN